MRTITLLYHDIVPGRQYVLSGFQSADSNIYKLDRGEFQRHLEEIATHSRQTPELLEARGDDARPRLSLTFDDGGASAALYVADMLEPYRWPAYFFVTTDAIGTKGFLSEEQIRAMRKRGHVIGSHSCSHPVRMSHCTPAQLDREWRDSVRRLEDILGERVSSASVPGGYYSRKVATAAAAAGIRTLFTSEPVTSTWDVDGCLVVGRFSVQQGVPAEWVRAVVAGRARPRLQRYLFWNAKKAMKAVGGELWLGARKLILSQKTEA